MGRDLGHVEEDPLPWLVLEGKLDETKLHRSRRVHEDADESSSAS